MTMPLSPPLIHLVRPLAGLSLLLAGTAAMAETQAGADLAVTGGYATNPYGGTGGNHGSATLTGTFSPSVIMTSPTGTTRLGGQVTHTEYSKRYSGTTSYNVGGSTSQQISPLTTLTGSAGFNSSVNNAFYPIYDPIGGIPTDPNAPIIVDPSGGTYFGQRTESLYGSLGVSTSLSPRDSVSVSGRISDVTYPNSLSTFNRGFTSYGGGLTYNRLIGRDTSIGLNVDVSRADYRGGSLGDSTQISPNLVFATRLAPRLSFNLSAGVTLADTNVLGGSSRRTYLSGSANLCNEGDRSSLCASLSRSVAPTSFAGTSAVTAFGLSHNYKLDTRSEISTRLSYSKADSIEGLRRSSDYGTASVGYNRRLTQRLAATLQLSYSDSFNQTFSRGSNFYGAAGIRYRLGNL
ncbi:MAG TPA: hypothetical protein VNS79_05365 [Sphingobium sp.]|nr:hypothetical protein [Sphingobium sp.]